jgi:hypothetical protein
MRRHHRRGAGSKGDFPKANQVAPLQVRLHLVN